jgi:hypothetical protein
MGTEPFEKLEAFAPGILEAVSPPAYAADPHRFFRLLYQAHLGLMQLQEAVREAGETLDYHTYNKDFDRKYITFSTNRYEGLLAAELLALGDTEHRRLWTPPGELLVNGGFRIQFDFAWVAAKVAVEVDGSSHNPRDGGMRHQQRSEKLKQDWAEQNDWYLHRVTWKEVMADPRGVAVMVLHIVASRS